MQPALKITCLFLLIASILSFVSYGQVKETSWFYIFNGICFLVIILILWFVNCKWKAARFEESERVKARISAIIDLTNLSICCDQMCTFMLVLLLLSSSQLSNSYDELSTGSKVLFWLTIMINFGLNHTFIATQEGYLKQCPILVQDEIDVPTAV